MTTARRTTDKLTAAALRSWRTTLIGMVTALATYIAMFPDDGWPVAVGHIAKFIMVGGLAGLGIFGKDSVVSNAPRLAAHNDRDDDDGGGGGASKDAWEPER